MSIIMLIKGTMLVVAHLLPFAIAGGLFNRIQRQTMLNGLIRGGIALLMVYVGFHPIYQEYVRLLLE